MAQTSENQSAATAVLTCTLNLSFVLTQYTLSATVHCPSILILFIHFDLQNFRRDAYMFVRHRPPRVHKTYCFPRPLAISVKYIAKEELKKFYRGSYIVIFTYPCNAIKKMLYKISFHKHFKFYLLLYTFLPSFLPVCTLH